MRGDVMKRIELRRFEEKTSLLLRFINPMSHFVKDSLKFLTLELGGNDSSPNRSEIDRSSKVQELRRESRGILHLHLFICDW